MLTAQAIEIDWRIPGPPLPPVTVDPATDATITFKWNGFNFVCHEMPSGGSAMNSSPDCAAIEVVRCASSPDAPPPATTAACSRGRRRRPSSRAPSRDQGWHLTCRRARDGHVWSRHATAGARRARKSPPRPAVGRLRVLFTTPSRSRARPAPEAAALFHYPRPPRCLAGTA